MTLPWIRATGAMLVTAVLAGLSVGAVHAATIVAPEYLAPHYRPDVVRDAGEAGGLFLDVRARGAVPQARLAEKTAAAVADSRLGEAAPVTTDAAGEAPATKVVIVFDPAAGTGYEDVCSGTTATGGDSLDEIMLTLCHDGAAISSVTASNGGATGVDSPAFAALLREAAGAAFPQRAGYLTGQGFWNASARN